MKDLTMSMFANRQDYEAAVAAQKAMTPHDELMALAGKWRDISHTHKIKADADNCAYPLSELRSLQFQAAEAATDFDALLDSDAFRAMARNDARYRWLRANAVNGSIGLPDGWLSCDEPESEWDAAIDAAASGATSEGGRDE